MAAVEKSYEFVATASFGLEAVVQRELRGLGHEDLRTENGRVHFRGDFAAMCRANLWLRAADRVLVHMGTFPARTFEELFEGTKALPWKDWIPEGGSFPVDGRSVRSQLSSVPTCQSIAKKAIVESLRPGRGKGWLEESGPNFGIEVSLTADMATLTIDTTGDGLFRRGYRHPQATAPLKETMAAGLILLSYWNAERPLMDPMCGTGTLLIEAAWIANERAPGLGREFAAEEWPWIPQQVWQDARDEAKAREKKQDLVLIGLDIDRHELSKAEASARRAGLERVIHFECADLSDFTTDLEYGCLITNPPYGERLGGDEEDLHQLYRTLSKVLRPLDTWSKYIFTAYPDLERDFHRKAERRRKLYNGGIPCTYYQYLGPRPPRPGPDGPA